MGKRLENTPKSRVRSALRMLWLRSRERAKALKLAGNCCHKCGVKASKAQGREVKVEVHHLDGVVWDMMLKMVYDTLLIGPDRLRCLCEKCHDEEHNNENLHGL